MRVTPLRFFTVTRTEGGRVRLRPSYGKLPRYYTCDGQFIIFRHSAGWQIANAIPRSWQQNQYRQAYYDTGLDEAVFSRRREAICALQAIADIVEQSCN